MRVLGLYSVFGIFWVLRKFGFWGCLCALHCRCESLKIALDSSDFLGPRVIVLFCSVLGML